MPTLPQPRGPVSDLLLAALRRPPAPLPDPPDTDFEDLQLALYCCYELHYRGFDGVDDAWEWEPALLAFRARLEQRLAADVRELAGEPGEPPDPDLVDVALRELMHGDEAPSVSTYIEREATTEQALEFLIHRSAYQLKEADPHSWAIPRLHGAPKAALVEIQADEYGGGGPRLIPPPPFARAVEGGGLDPAHGAPPHGVPGGAGGPGKPHLRFGGSPP